MADKKQREPSLLRKLTAKAIMEVKELKVPTKPVDLYTIFGIANGVRTGDSQYGAWLGFVGTFEAVRVEDGAVFQSNQCFIPEPVMGMLKAQVEKHPEGVEFAVMIGIKPSPREPDKKYEYTVRPLVKPADTGVLNDLRTKALAALPSLAR